MITTGDTVDGQSHTTKVLKLIESAVESAILFCQTYILILNPLSIYYFHIQSPLDCHFQCYT